MSNSSHLLKRLHEIEDRIQDLKSELEPPSQANLARRALRKTPMFVLSNWGFFAFLISVALAVGVYWYYDVSYFESQKNTSELKQAAESYRKLGDYLILHGERDAAEDAFKNAVRINPNNVDAMRELLEVQVFDTPEGQKEIDPDLVDKKIEYLRTLITDPKGGFIIGYLKGERLEDQGKYAEAKAAYKEATDENPDFVYGYIESAYVSILAGDGVDFSVDQLQKAVAKDQNSSFAHNNLGYCYMLKGDYEEAFKHFELANHISPFLETFVNLGEVERYIGGEKNLMKAVSYHTQALDLLRDTEDEDESDIAGELAMNYLPEEPGDNLSPTGWATFSTISQKKCLVYYQLSLDYASIHNWANANRAFAQAFQLDEDHTYAEFVDNRIQSMKSFAKLDDKAIRWFEEKRRREKRYIVADDIEGP